MSPIPWTVNSEIYPLNVRGVGNGAAIATNWVFNFIIAWWEMCHNLGSILTL